MSVFDGRAVITGAGMSEVGRRLGRSGLDLTAEACLRAIADAGLEVDDVDGVATYPGGHSQLGFSGAGAYELKEALGLEVDWFMAGPDTAGQLGPIIEACMAVSLGLANHVVCFRSVWEGTAQQRAGGRGELIAGSQRIDGGKQWSHPFGAFSAVHNFAMYAQRYMYEYGLTREQLAQVALTARANASLNPDAVYRDPMSMEDYLNARMIAEPLCLYDCDAPCDGAVAIVVSRDSAAGSSPNPPVVVESVGTALWGRFSWDQRADLTTMAAFDAATNMWDRTSMTAADIDILEAYDGFSYITLQWIEALGFCGRGEAGRFVEGGHRIARDGDLPLNTQGGQLSGGRLHGVGFLHEACLQLWGRGGDRQVARQPVTAVAAAGGGPIAGCMVLRLP